MVDRAAIVDDLSVLSAFLVWAETDNALYGSYTATQVLEAFTRIVVDMQMTSPNLTATDVVARLRSMRD